MPKLAPVTEDDIYFAFMHKGTSLIDAVMALQEIGYDHWEAERIVFEWIDGLEDDDDEDD